MIDVHYDLLTILYCCYLKNDYSYVEKLQKDLKDVDGMIANLYFMSKDEMSKELGIEKIDVVEMFKISTNLFREHFRNKKVIFSIEGCDYVSIDDLENLYRLGLRNILLVWNNQNIYGSGNRSDMGLTKLGEEFIKKCVELGICIDLSHMNESTFWDVVKLLKELKQSNNSIRVIASHSNSYFLCNNKRNLSDKQIDAIKELNGMIGLVSYGPFVNSLNADLHGSFLEHVKYVEKIIGIDNVMIATDNMDFAVELFGVDEEISIFNHKTVKTELTKILQNYYNKEEIDKILFKNVERLFKEMELC